MNSTTALRSAAIGFASLLLLGVSASPAFAGDATFPPTANADYFTIIEDNELVVGADIGILANDLDGGNAGLAVNSVSTIAEGTLNWGPAGNFRFIPATGFIGTAHFTYDDVASGYPSNTSDIYIEVTPAYPVGNPDAYETFVNTPLVIDIPGGVLANDLYTGLVGGEDEAEGEIVMGPDGDFVYTPALDFVGTKTFTYYVLRFNQVSHDTLVTITVKPVTIIPTVPVTSTISTIPGAGTPDSPAPGDEDVQTLAYTGDDDVTAWLVAPGLALLGVGIMAVWFARRRAARQ